MFDAKACRAVLVGLALVVGALAFVKAGHAQQYPRAEVVKIENDRMVGSAVVLDGGFLLSADHIARMHKKYQAMQHDGRPMRLVASTDDDRIDIALFRADTVHCPCAEIARTEAAMDEPVVIVSYPNGITSVVMHGESQGVIDIEGFGKRLTVSAAVGNGSSGGGVFARRDGRWVLVGVVVEGTDVATFAIPVQDIRAFLRLSAR